MKRIIKLLIIALGVLFTSCSTEFDDSNLRNRVEELNARAEALEALVEGINQEIQSLRSVLLAIDNQEMITGYKPLSDGSGYIISFEKSGDLTVYHGEDVDSSSVGIDGQDGISPVISVAKDDTGNYCWTLDGEFLVNKYGEHIYLTLVAGSGMDGKVPQLRVLDGYWEISYDGLEWERLGMVSESIANPNQSIYKFSNVEIGDEYVIFTLADGSTLKSPKIGQLSLQLYGWEDVVLVPLFSHELTYKVSGATSKTKVYGMANGGLEVRIVSETSSTGKIIIDVPSKIISGQILIYADNGYGSTSMRMLSFEAGKPIEVNDVENYDSLIDFDWGIETGGDNTNG